MSDENGVIVYTTEPCGFCRQAKALLEARGVDYSEVNLAKDPVGRSDLVALTGQMTFPQILVGERSVGGFRELVEADRAGTLEELLKPSSSVSTTASRSASTCGRLSVPTGRSGWIFARKSASSA